MPMMGSAEGFADATSAEVVRMDNMSRLHRHAWLHVFFWSLLCADRAN